MPGSCADWPYDHGQGRTQGAGRTGRLRVTSAVSGKTALLVAADPWSQSGKAKAARQLGVRIVTEQVFLYYLEQIFAPAAQRHSVCSLKMPSGHGLERGWQSPTAGPEAPRATGGSSVSAGACLPASQARARGLHPAPVC